MSVNRDRLKQAAANIESVMATLDISRAECESCRIGHNVNRTEAQMYKEMEALVRKLDRFANNPNLPAGTP